MRSSADEVAGDGGTPARGASARERALRFNRSMIGLGLVALMVMLFIPI